MPNVYAVIMAGGAGTRFWPASRSARPKQLLPLAGASGETLLAATVRRLDPLVPPERVYVVTGEHLKAATAAAVPAVPAAQILCEPAARNTAPCIAWANATIARRDPSAVVIVLPSDHFITDEAAFRAVLEAAVESARTGKVTTIGIVPTRPETGYGYIEVGAETGGAGGARTVSRFVEKPDRARAETFLAAGPTRYLWNAGMFFFEVSAMNALIAQHLPAMAAGVERIGQAEASGDPARAASTLREVFPTLESISIDHGIMEKASGLAVVPGDFGWNDVGSWESAWELASKDEAGNALGSSGQAPEASVQAIAIDARNNLVRSLRTTAGTSDRTIALVGVDNLVVVETDDAILVIPRDRAQDVRLVVDALKKTGRTTLV